MDFKELKELLTIFDDSSIREFSLDKDEFNLYLSKNEQGRPVTEPVETPSQQVLTDVQPVTSQPLPQRDTSGVSQEAVTAEGKTVDSPIVGVIYLSSSPDEPVFKKVGDQVAVGDTLCIVEAMKIMNEITSDISGTITEILIENEDVVEFGQALFRIA